MDQKNHTSIGYLINKPAGHSAKEAEPNIAPAENSPLQEVVEQQVEKEVMPYISPRQETIELPPDVKKLGAQSVGTPQFSSYQNVKLPISDDKVIKGMHAPITSSFRWLATLAVYILKLAHVQLKIVHGKVVRVFKK
jgi:hypothetical protein